MSQTTQIQEIRLREGAIMKEGKKAVADKIAAEEIEVKKTVRKTARKAKEAEQQHRVTMPSQRRLR